MANVTFTSNHQPAPACYPSDVNGLLDLLSTGGGLNGTIPDNAGGGVFVGSSPPTSALTNKVWFKTDAAGRPTGVFMFYNGNWRRVYSGGIGDVKMFVGNPSGLFDGTGRGVVGGFQDGWALCNGQNGTPNMTDRFVVGATWNGSNWVSAVEGVPAKTQGGVGVFNLTASQVPAMSVTAFGVATAQPGAGAFAIGSENDTARANWNVRSGGIPVGSPQTTINNTPPWYAMAYAMFVGYA